MMRMSAGRESRERGGLEDGEELLSIVSWYGMVKGSLQILNEGTPEAERYLYSARPVVLHAHGGGGRLANLQHHII